MISCRYSKDSFLRTPALSWRKHQHFAFWAGNLGVYPSLLVDGCSEIELSITSTDYGEFLCEFRNTIPEDLSCLLPRQRQNLPRKGSAVPLATASFAVCDDRAYLGSVSQGELVDKGRVIEFGFAYCDEARFQSFLTRLFDVLSDSVAAMAAVRPDGIISENFWVPDPFTVSLYFAKKDPHSLDKQVREICEIFGEGKLSSEGVVEKLVSYLN